MYIKILEIFTIIILTIAMSISIMLAIILYMETLKCLGF